MVCLGRKKFLLNDFKRKKDMGTFKGPFIPRMPDRFVRRMIRGMLPYKKDKGKNAYKRIMCYIGIPKELEGKDMAKIENGHISKVMNLNYVSVSEICKKLGRKGEK